MTVYGDPGDWDESVSEDETETSGEDETTEGEEMAEEEETRSGWIVASEDTSITMHLIPTDASVSFRPRMKLFDEFGNPVRQLGEPGFHRRPWKPFNQEDRERARKRRERHHTRRWYAKQLLAILNGELNLTEEQREALFAYGRLKGWNRRPPRQR